MHALAVVFDVVSIAGWLRACAVGRSVAHQLRIMS